MLWFWRKHTTKQLAEYWLWNYRKIRFGMFELLLKPFWLIAGKRLLTSSCQKQTTGQGVYIRAIAYCKGISDLLGSDITGSTNGLTTWRGSCLSLFKTEC